MGKKVNFDFDDLYTIVGIVLTVVIAIGIIIYKLITQ